jgi:hypothetical protein
MGAKKRGPKPERLAIEGNWRDAVAHVLKRGKPPDAKPKKGKKIRGEHGT